MVDDNILNVAPDVWARGAKLKTELVSICASEVEMEPVEWVWPGRIAKGKHTCIAGEPGAGKSQLTMFIAATITMGGQWPCGEGQSPKGSVVILSAEDGIADTIKPRLRAVGADEGSVHIIKAVTEGGDRRSFNLQRDLLLLEALVDRIKDVLLVIIDPVSSYLGKTDSHKNADVRGVLEPLGEFAERKGVAVLSVTHFSKAGANTSTKALHRFIGSIAFVGAPRVALAVVEDEDTGRRLVLHAKNNLAMPPKGLAYRITETIVGDGRQLITASRAVFDAEHVTITADDALASDAGDKASSRLGAEDFLSQALADGPVPVEEVNSDAESLGISKRTLERARRNLGVKAKRSGGLGKEGVWTLSLPLRPPTLPKTAT